ncbi:signal peptidase I [Oikeobacillus pervagus]|uniref:Signal peptidase I n=1 Tax=Oikeobacillus pervagus TaxID=1325931 RepID=A0AAJ1SZS5_9BACI|nr:signal peptidase I [Oikeobacillus pervagus]MDQ0215869.1 signal peptidase I [Oikeobacillus pervagus]
MSNSRNEIFSWVKSIGIALLIVMIVRHFIFVPQVVKGESMMPTLQDGNKVIVSKISEIERFDQIVFHAPDKEANYVKRVIGLPGDQIEMVDDTLYINGKAYKEPYLQEYKKDLLPYQKFTGNFDAVTVPNGHLFVMGDNRLKSKDSRHFGAITESAVIGKVTLRFWPLNEVNVTK